MFQLAQFLIFVHLLITFTATSNSCELTASAVNCNNQNLTAIPENTFPGKVNTLMLSDNNFVQLGDGEFTTYPALSRLYVANNDIINVDSNAFSDLPNLIHLDLSHNHLTSLNARTVQRNGNLTSIGLVENNFRTTSDNGGPFLISASLENLDLSKNQLQTVGVNSFSKMPRLALLDLRDNDLKDLQPEVFSVLKELKSVFLSGNPWKCGNDLDRLLAKMGRFVKDCFKLECVDERGVKAPVSLDACTAFEPSTSGTITSGTPSSPSSIRKPLSPTILPDHLNGGTKSPEVDGPTVESTVQPDDSSIGAGAIAGIIIGIILMCVFLGWFYYMRNKLNIGRCCSRNTDVETNTARNPNEGEPLNSEL